MNGEGSIHVKLFTLSCLNNLYLHFHHCAGPLCVLLQQPPSTSASVATKKNSSNYYNDSQRKNTYLSRQFQHNDIIENFCCHGKAYFEKDGERTLLTII